MGEHVPKQSREATPLEWRTVLLRLLYVELHERLGMANL